MTIFFSKNMFFHVLWRLLEPQNRFFEYYTSNFLIFNYILSILRCFINCQYFNLFEGTPGSYYEMSKIMKTNYKKAEMSKSRRILKAKISLGPKYGQKMVAGGLTLAQHSLRSTRNTFLAIFFNLDNN